MAMGARPVAVMDQLRFGAADAPGHPPPRRWVVRGIGGYGNSWACPNIGGETVFDASYPGNPLVNAMCVGVLRKGGPPPGLRLRHGQQDHPVRRPHRSRRNRRVSVLASDTFGGDGSGWAARSCLGQVGDPFMEKVLIECCLELYAAGLVIGIQDLGGAGLSCATSEFASAGDGGTGSNSTGCRCADEHDAGGGAPANPRNACARWSPRERREVHGRVPQVGRHRDGDRRGHRG